MCGGGTVDAPFGRQHSLVAAHPDVTGLVYLTHEVANGLVVGHLEIEVGFHTATVHVSGHRVPHAAGGQLGHTHLQLASGKHLVHDHLVDVALVAHLQTTHVSHHGIGLGHFLAGILLVGCGAVEVELGGLAGVLAGEHHVAVAAANVECFLEAELKDFVAHFHAAVAAYVEDTDLAAGGEEWCLQRVDGLEFELLFHGFGTAHDHAVVHRVYHVHLVVGKHSLDKEVAAYAFGVITFCVLRVGRIANLIICFHKSI